MGIYYARVMRDRDLLLKCHQTMDEMGYGPEICATLRVNLASMFMGFQMRSPKGKLYKPDFIIEFHICDSQSKSTQIAWEHYKIPYFVLEIPLFPPERIETGKDYMVAQMDECIRWMEKVAGKKYDDEKLVESVYNEWDGRVMWSRVAEFQKAIPAPLDQKMFNSFATLMMWGPHQQPVADVLRELCEETRQRVDEGIAGVSTERCRLLHEGQPPWFNRAFLRYPNLYGASYLGSAYLWGLWGAFHADADGTWTVPLTPRERGIKLRSREDALRSLADLALDHSPIVTSHMVAPQVAATVKMVKDWHVDGVVLHIDRGCKGQSAANAETRLALRDEG
ncbi:MAG: 2-hydroxyacyl-CoA dehydratase family protein, partial [Dehalococcoidia bacterium]|nr:2-hydroxyacyl-CoA dehydratase family protein [Dehalococcoidia bacterium]